MATEWEAVVRTFGSAAVALDVLMAEGALERTVLPDAKSISVDTTTGDLKCPVGAKGAECGSETFQSSKALMAHIRINHASFHAVCSCTPHYNSMTWYVPVVVAYDCAGEGGNRWRATGCSTTRVWSGIGSGPSHRASVAGT